MRLYNQARLRELRRSHRREVETFCSHEVREFERFAHRSADQPAPPLIGPPTRHEPRFVEGRT
jgi:hypothetical protein